MLEDSQNEVPESSRRRILLLGFREAEAAALSKLLMNGLFISSPAVVLGFATQIEIGRAELVILQLETETAVKRWLSIAAEHGAKTIVCGKLDDILARQMELGQATDILVLPGTPSEWIYRVNRLLGTPPANLPAAAPSITPASPKCLVVDDDESVRSLVGALCSNLHIDLRTAADGIRALAIAQEWQPDLIVLDLNLPLLSGIEVLRRLRENPVTKHTPVLCLTGCDDQETMARVAELGATCYMVKPFSPMAVSRRIKHLAKAKAA